MSHAHDRVRPAVVDGEAIGREIDERRAGEDDVRHVTDLLVRHLGREEVVAGTGDHTPGLVEVEQSRPHRIDEPVARREDAVVDHEPPLVRLDRDRACADLRRLPAPAPRPEDVPVAAPVDQVGALGEEDVAERRVAVVARPAQHQVAPSDPAWEEDPVAVEGEVGVVELVEGHEVVGRRNSDRGAVVAVAPGHVVPVLEPRHARVVGVLERPLDLGNPRIRRREDDRLLARSPSRRRRRSGPRGGSSCGSVSSTRKTPAKRSPNGTTAELKMLLERGRWSRAMIGFRLERQSVALLPGGRLSHGIGAAGAGSGVAGSLTASPRRSRLPSPGASARRAAPTAGRSR